MRSVVRYQVLRSVDVVDDLRDEEGAPGFLLRDQAQMLVAPAGVPFWNRDAPEPQIGSCLRPQLLGADKRGRRLHVSGRSADEHRQCVVGVLGFQPRTQIILPVLADSSIHHDWRGPVRQVLCPEACRVDRGQERKRSLLRVAIALVVDVVEDQTIQTQRSQALLCHIGDLLGPLRSDRDPRRSQCKEQKLTPPCRDPSR